MIKSFFKTAGRNLLKNKLFSLINIAGLAAGMAVALLIGIWIKDEVSFDSYFQKYRQIATVMSTQTWNDQTSTDQTAAVPLADELRKKYSDDFKNITLVSEHKDHILSVGEKKISGEGAWVQSEFPDMFTIRMFAGRRSVLNDPAYLLLSKSIANALFGNADPIGQTLLIDNKFNLKVGGIYKDFPANTRFYGLAILLPWNNQANDDNQETGWSNHHFQLFVEMNNYKNLDRINNKIKDITKAHIKTKSVEEILLQPLDRVYLYDEFENGKCVGGRIQFVKLFGCIGAIVLLLACINFMNLSTARSEKRAIEIGIRKTIGSSRRQLIIQFLCESLLVAFFSFLLTLSIVQLVLPFFNEMTGKGLAIPWNTPLFWLLIIGFTFFTGLLSGSYPALYLSGLKPIKVLKGKFHVGRFASLPRKLLVVFQFSVSICLIIGTIIVFKQIQFAKNRPVGYGRDGLISIGINAPELSEHYNALRNDLLQSGAIENMAESSSPSTNVRNSIVSFDWAGRDPGTAPLIGLISVTHDFGKTIGWTIKEGRDFSRDFPADTGAFIINEATEKLIGFKQPIGKTIKLGDKEHIITGVIDDMIMESPFMSVQPTIFWLDYEWRIRHITLRINAKLPLHEALSKIEVVFKKYSPEVPFEYQFTKEEYAIKFFDQERIGNLANIFSALAIFISCLGLFGLATFIAEQRTKEIGIRKVLGATVFNLWKLLSTEFVILVFLSFLIAVPTAYYFMHQWLQSYQYRYKISGLIFIATGAGAFLITLITISFQVIKAALANPVKSFRIE